MSDNIVESYRIAAVSDNVAYTEFILAYKKEVDTLYCFYEGQEDFAYYPIRIKNISSVESYKDFNCGGKENVIKVRELIKANQYYNIAKTGFFIDKDFDNYVVAEDIYVTPTYSIENLYVMEAVVGNIIVSEFGFKTGTPDYIQCIEIYKKLLKSFNNKITVFNSWLSCQADYRNSHQGITRLKIDLRSKNLFEKIVLPDLSEVKNFVEIDIKEKIQEIYHQSPEIDEAVLNIKIDEFRHVDQSIVFRGKFLLKMLISFLSRLQSIFGTQDNPFQNKYSCNLRIETATGCSALSQYAVTPPCLKLYILKYLN